MALPSDYAYLVLGESGQNVYVYKYDGTRFNSFQTITLSGSGSKYVSITNDHQLLTVSDRTANTVNRYFFNQTAQEFQPFANQLPAFSSDLWFAEVNQNRQLLFVCTLNQTYVYTDIENNITELQTLKGGQSYLKVSEDGKYVIIGGYG